MSLSREIDRLNMQNEELAMGSNVEESDPQALLFTDQRPNNLGEARALVSRL